MPSHHRPRPRLAAIMGAAALSAIVLPAAPGRSEPAPPFAELVREARSTAPRLRVAEAEVDRAEGQRRQATARPNPTVALEAENFAGTGPFRSFDQAETTLAVSQPLELGGKRAARIAAGEADVSAARLQRDQGRADFVFDLAAAYLEADASDQRLAQAQANLTLAQDDARAAAILVKAGKEAELRSLTANAAVSEARANVQSAQAGRATAFSRLTALAGAGAPLTSLTQSLLAHADRAEPPPSIDPLEAPGYVAARAAREAAARRIRVEQSRAAPDLTVSLGVRRLNGAGSADPAATIATGGPAATALVGGVSIPFPVFDRNKGNIAAAQAELRAAEARLEGARLDAEAEIRSALAQISASEAGVAAALEGHKAAEEAYRRTRTGYETGKLTLLELIDARRAVTTADAQLLNARLSRLTAEAALARLQGQVPFGDRP